MWALYFGTRRSSTLVQATRVEFSGNEHCGNMQSLKRRDIPQRNACEESIIAENIMKRDG